MAGHSTLTIKTLLYAIRRKCLDCAGGSREEIEKCPARECPLHPFRIVVEQGVLPGTTAEDDKVKN